MVLIAIPAISLAISVRLKAQQPAGNVLGIEDIPLTTVPSSSPDSAITTLKQNLDSQARLADSAPTPDPAVSVSFGPTMSLNVQLEGRPANKNGGKVFVGIAPGNVSSNPQYLLSFTITMPDSGTYSGLSLAGLSYGSTYTAYIKGQAQLVKAIPFVATATGVNLNSDLPIVLTTGDLNEDNVVDQLDYGIALAALGSTPSLGKWNPNIDFNTDGVVNNYDLGILIKNLTKTGDSGPWYSRLTNLNAPASPTPGQNVGGASASAEASASAGYWMWVPGTK